MLIEITYNVTDVYMSTTETPVYVEISFEQPGGTSAVWGSITGTLSNQTDLQNALNAKFDDPTGTTSQYIRGDGTLATFPALTGYVPYTGATTNVDLGEYELKAGQVTLDTTPTGTAAVGTTRWNDTIGATETTLKGGSVVLKNGVDLVARVVNKVSPNTTLTKAAYQAVRVSGAQGQRLAIALAQANNDTNSADTIGLVTETIPTNQEGFIMTMGQLENINTTGSLQGETWVDGDVLYLSPTVAGAITNVKPTGAGHIVVIGYVEYAHANNGKIYVKVLNGWELTELHDTEIVSPANNEALIYESSTALWKNKTIATALGFTPANAATTLTINGVTYDLSTSRSWTVAAGISGSGASGQVTYWTGASAVSGSNNLFWDNANGRLNLGTTLPTTIATQNIFGTSTFVGVSIKNNSSASGSTQACIVLESSTSSIASLFKTGSNYTTYKIITSNDLGFYNSSAGDISILNDLTTGRIKFAAGASSTSQMTLFANGNLAINNGVTDLGVRLGVVGDTLLRGSGATSATTALTVQNSSSTNLLTVRNDGPVFIHAVNSVATLYMSANGDSSFQKSTSGTNGIQLYGPTSAHHTLSISSFSSDNYSNGALSSLRFNGNYVSSAGSTAFSYMLINGTINQTGGANGITRGLYVNPTLTAAADFRAIETTAGNVLFGSNFFWDNANGRLGIGTNVPAYALDVRTTSGFIAAAFKSQYATTGYIWTDNSGIGIGVGTDGFTSTFFASSSALIFRVNNTQIARVYNTGNLVLQNGGTFSDGGQRLQVYGDTLLRGSGATSATTALTVQNSSSTNLFTVQNNGVTTISATGNNNTTFSTTGQSVYNTYAPSGQISWIIGVETQYFLGYSGRNILLFSRDRNHTTGGIDNNYIGFGHISPTANVDIAASTTARASLRIRSGTAPTTPNDGDIWFDGTNIQMRIGGVTKTFTLI